MKLTSRCEYAMLALVHLGRQKTGELVSVDQIARTQKIPAKFLEQIMLVLKRAKHVRSSKGRQGGYQLAKPAHKITLDTLVQVFREIRDYAAKKLEKTTIADVL